MKFTSLILTLLITFSLNAQKVKYNNGNILFDGEELQTIEVKLSPNVSTIKDKFSDWMDDHYDVNLNGKKLLFFDKEFMSAKGVVIPQISDRKIDLRVKVDETSKGKTILHVFAAYGYNNWITPENHPYAYDALRGIVYDFVSDYLPQYYYERVEDSEDMVEDLREDNEDIQADLANNRKEIKELLKKNDNLRLELETNKSELKKANEKLILREQEYQKVKKRVSGMK